jgi:hypothetical protein
MRRLFIPILLFGLSGCYHWEKNGVGRNDELHDIEGTECMAGVDRRIPAVHAIRLAHPAYVTPESETCRTVKSGDKNNQVTTTNCEKIPAIYHPEEYEDYVVNQNERDIAYTNCMNQKGWRLVKDK